MSTMTTNKKQPGLDRNLIVIGNGMVSYKLCEKLIEKRGQEFYNIIVFGEEKRHAYDRVHLTDYFSGKSAEDLSLSRREWYDEHNIKLYLGDPIVTIDSQAKIVQSKSGIILAYTELVFATGSKPFVPSIPGVDKHGVFVYRTIEDLDQIKAYAEKRKTAAVIGGGLLGLEAAKAVLDLGLRTHIIEFAPRLMPRQLDDEGSMVLKNKLESLGLSIHLNTATSSINGDEAISSMSFKDAEDLDVDLLVISAGIQPRDELAKTMGLDLGPRGGILVNEKLQSSDPHIYAIGEVAFVNNVIYGLVAPGYDMADIVASNLTMGDKSFNGADLSTKLKLIGTDVASFGDAFGETPKSKVISFVDKLSGIYKRINITEDGKYLLGGILVGDASSYNQLLQIAKNKMILPPEPQSLLLGHRSSDDGGMGVDSLPDEAMICSCEHVSKGQITASIADHQIADVPGIKACTKAGTGCGGCVPMLGDLLTETFKSQGKVIKKQVCEHFIYSRQELYDIVKVNSIRSFDDLISNHGKGSGCEICKPVVASLLASIWNEAITNHQVIQDTNDRYLANIQKGGTYSVVPRVPGGEITPEKLIALGEVAKEFDLYCKITGGQRIDLFGAKVNDLPFIWEKLIEAGFESGHAYGKAVRTVKSCVGSTWCRYGVQDSVSFAIRIEERYKGIRAPHKLKSAVSGCARECAEAQSKDFGIIATEKGWNIYVCGNGGMKPQHAKLLASDVDDETCIKYLDRFMMYYIKTADPLTRTATWLNKLEGGIDYLKDVVVNDSLGIAHQLETEMAQLVNTYKCEWKDVVENQEKRQKFSHYINTREYDNSISFKEMRGQRIPATW